MYELAIKIKNYKALKSAILTQELKLKNEHKAN